MVDSQLTGKHMKLLYIGILSLLTSILCGCAYVPVQEQILKNANGGEIICKQVGTGLISSSAGKARFDDCVANAKASGYQ